jgi:hypothetical protein
VTTCHIRIVLAAALVQAWLIAPASAQAPSTGQRHRLEAAIGGLWIGGGALGTTDAELRANRVPEGPFRLFTTDSEAAAAGGFDARLGYWLTESLAVEAGVVRTRPDIETRVSADAEGAGDITLAEQLDQYFIEASVVWALDRFRIGERTVPFVSGGAGYLRQLHEGRTLIETGQVYHVGAGFRHQLFAGLKGIRALGVRVDGRLYFLVDGVQLEERARRHGAVTGALFLTF